MSAPGPGKWRSRVVRVSLLKRGVSVRPPPPSASLGPPLTAGEKVAETRLGTTAGGPVLTAPLGWQVLLGAGLCGLGGSGGSL